MIFLETSAKHNLNVREMFCKAGLEIMKKVKSGSIGVDEAGSQGVKRNKEFRRLDTEQNRCRLQALGSDKGQENSADKCC